MKILAIGDVVGRSGVDHLRLNLRKNANALGADLVIVNGENAAEIHGILPTDAEELFCAGADVITTGNHAFGRREIYSYLDDEKYILRPDNYPGSAPGHGYVIINVLGVRVLVMNIQGNVWMKVSLASPFTAADSILERERGKYDIAVLDFHAEASSEKLAMGHYLDGRVSVIFGTHTHIQTADEQILPNGTGYISDLGMSGPQNGILGVDSTVIVDSFLTAMPSRYRVADGRAVATGALFELDGKRCISVKRVKF